MLYIYFLPIILIFMSAFADIFLFLAITKFQCNWKQYISLFCGLITISICSSIDAWFSILANFAEILLLLLVFSKENNQLTVLGTGLICVGMDCLADTFENAIPRWTRLQPLEMFLLNFVCYTLLFCLIWLLRNRINTYLNNKESNISFLMTISYIYISLLLLNLIVIQKSWFVNSTIILSLMVAFQMIFAIIMFSISNKIEKSLLSKQEQKSRNEYLTYLEESEDNLRAFRHDYRNLLNSLKVSALENDDRALLKKLEQYSEENLDSQALLKYQDTNHIQIKAIKSIIITKLSKASNYSIPYHFECRNPIYNIPGRVDELDLVRIIGIAFDNAIEASLECINAKNEANAEVQAMLYQDSPSSLEFEIRNRIMNSNLEKSTIRIKGFTTKKGHQGLGMANLQEIEHKYPNLSIDYSINQNWFDFYLSIDEEGNNFDV